MVEEVAAELEGRVDVYKVMVDRICTAREISPASVSVRSFPSVSLFELKRLLHTRSLS